RAMDQLPAGQSRRQLVATIYESFPTPEEGFSALAGYLDSPRPAAAIEVFDYWTQQGREHEWSKRRQEELRQPLPPEPNPEKANSQKFWRQVQQSEDDAWKDSSRHADTRLTEKQFTRLLALKDVWVRALWYAHFPDRCPADWVAALHRNLRQS